MATILDDERRYEFDAPAGARLTISGESLEATLGWTLKPEGLCRGDVCVPVRDRSTLVAGDSIDVEGLAAALGRPAVVDAARGVAALGTAATSVTEAMRSLDAPDFTLPDLDGRMVSLKDFDQHKRLILAWSSW